MQLRTCVSIGLIVVLVGLGIAGVGVILNTTSAPPAYAGAAITVNTFKVVAAATVTHEGVTRTVGELEIGRDTITLVGDTLPSVATPEIHDTSIVMASDFWEALTLQTKFVPRASPAQGGADSAGVKVYLEQSNDGEHFVVVDSLTTADSNWTYKNMGVQHWAWSRFRMINTAKMDSAGAIGSAVAHAWGRF